MRIAQVAPLQIAVPPKKYGGTERVIATLTEALVRLGHDVTLFASADSKTIATLAPMLKREIFFNPTVDSAAHHIAMLHEIYTRRASEFDVIHSHLDYFTLPFTRLSATPTVLTLHGRLDHEEVVRVFSEYPEANYVSISDDQRKPLPQLNWVSTVHHGIDVDRIKPSYKQGDYLCFVGRMSPEKRPDLAIEVAKRVGMKLKLAAKVDHTEEEYFKREIEPLMDHPLIEWLGEVNEEQKRELMAGAYALILPIDWPEPFGIVFIEALACGTPVVASPRGSVPEILKDGLTGFSGCTVDELVAAVHNVKLISRRGCRAYAKRRFDTRRMALEYMNVYARVQGRENLFRQPEPFVTEAANDQVERVALP